MIELASSGVSWLAMTGWPGSTDDTIEIGSAVVLDSGWFWTNGSSSDVHDRLLLGATKELHHLRDVSGDHVACRVKVGANPIAPQVVGDVLDLGQLRDALVGRLQL